jgi:two-component sensor histidine kinase
MAVKAGRNVGLLASPGSSGRRVNVRALYYIAAAVLALLIPLIIFAGYWVRSEFTKNQQVLEEYLFGRASALSQRIDSEIRQEITVLQGIAALPSLDSPDLEAFRLQAERMVSAVPQWGSLGLLEPSGRQVVNTLAPVGAELPATTAPEVVGRVVEGRQTEIFTGSAGGGGLSTGHTVIIFTPVIRDNVVRFVLAAGMRASVVQEIAERQIDDPRLLTVVIDERENILARSRAIEQFIGRQANEELRRATSGKTAGLFIAPTLDRQEVFTAFQRSPVTGWVSVAATDRQQFETLSRRGTWTMIATAAASFALAAALAAFLFYNVLERRLAEERLAASEALGDLDARLLTTTQEALGEQRKAASEREILLREIYHRVKNNLQIIQSLLRLGSRDLKGDQREPFESAVRRIGAMARVHTLLYNSPDLASIDFKEYLEGLVGEIADAFGADERGIRTGLDVEPMRIPLDTAVPLAFIAVEILTNAFKHAFPLNQAGVITITASRAGETGVLSISDNGVGLSDAKAPRRSLGLTIVTKLLEQIGGTMERPEDGRTTFRIVFPLNAATAAPLPQERLQPAA